MSHAMGRKNDGARTDPRWRSHIEPAPGDLRIVQAWVNTDRSDRGEELSAPRVLADWLKHWDLLSRGTELEPADHGQAIEARSGLRALIRANHGPPPAPAVTAALDRMAAAAPIRVRFFSDGGARLEPVTSGLGEALARLFEIVALAQRAGRWRRLKLCQRRDCRAAFYDFSPGVSAKWCSRRCGTKGSSKTYRGRRKRYREQARRQRPASA